MKRIDRKALFLCLFLITVNVVFFILTQKKLKNSILHKNLIEFDADAFQNETIIKTKPSVFCIIFTRPIPDIQRLRLNHNTWAKYCDNYVYVAKLAENQTNLTNEFPILQPNSLMNDTYEALTSKSFYTFRDVYLNYSDYDWYLKADDDSFIFVDNMKGFLKEKNESEPVTYGYNFKSLTIEQGYHSGGAGYILSKESLNRLGKQLVLDDTFCFNGSSGYEDEDVARCLRKLNVYPGNSTDDEGRERFHPFTIIDHIYGYYPPWLYRVASNPLQNGAKSISDTTISFHYVEIEKLEKLYNLWKRYKEKVKNKKKTKLLSYLLYTII